MPVPKKLIEDLVWSLWESYDTGLHSQRGMPVWGFDSYYPNHLKPIKQPESVRLGIADRLVEIHPVQRDVVMGVIDEIRNYRVNVAYDARHVPKKVRELRDRFERAWGRCGGQAEADVLKSKLTELGPQAPQINGGNQKTNRKPFRPLVQQLEKMDVPRRQAELLLCWTVNNKNDVNVDPRLTELVWSCRHYLAPFED